MIKVLLYSVQPILASGLQAVLAPVNGLALSGVCSTVGQLMEHVQREPPDLLLLELTEDVTLEVLSGLGSMTAMSRVILWTDLISTEFASEAIGVGVRGILRVSLPVELQIKCLVKVAGGALWVEKALSDKLLCTSQLVLTARERQLAVLLTQGLKNKELAQSLGVTEGTVKVYLSHLLRKVGVRNRFELAVFAMDPSSLHRAGTAGPIAGAAKEESSTMSGMKGSVKAKLAPGFNPSQGRPVCGVCGVVPLL